jgi:hypothetical protein
LFKKIGEVTDLNMLFSSKKKITIWDLDEGDLIEFSRVMGIFSHWAVYVG